MQINVIYDQSVSSLPSGFVAAVTYVVNYLDSLFTNPVTVNIDLGYGEIGGQALGSGALGESETYLGSSSYSTVVNALKSNEPGASQRAAYSTLPAASPLAGGTLWLSTAQEKALGLLSGNATSVDGYVGISSTYSFSYSPTATPAGNQYYLVGVLEHEFTEIMGRTSFLGDGIGGTTSYSVMDLFRYAAAGTRQLGTGAPAYFSIDNGATNIDSWNTNPNGDLGDWAGSAGADSFLAFSPTGQIDGFSNADLTLMNVLGWDSTPANSITVAGTASEAPQGGAPITLLASAPAIADSSSSTLASASIKIANDGGSLVSGDELYVNGVQNGALGNGVTAGWNNSTKILTLTGRAPIAVYQSLLGAVTYQDAGADASTGSHPRRTVTWTINDGATNLTATSQIAIDRSPAASSDSATALVGTALVVAAANGVLANDTDPDRDTLTATGVSDLAHGAGTIGQPLAGVYGHLTLNADGSYSYVADIAAALNNAPTGHHLQDSFSYAISDGNGGASGATLTITLDRLPALATVAGLRLDQGQSSVAASALFSAGDADGDAITTYDFWNIGTGNGHFIVNGVAQPSGQDIFVNAAQLAQVSYQDGSASDTLWVRANDGYQWSAWSPAFTVSPWMDVPPTVTVANLAAAHGQSFASSSLFTASVPVGETVAMYAFWDTGAGGGHFVVNGVAEAANQEIDVSAAQLPQVSYESGSGADTLWVRASDGASWGAWSNAFTVTGPVDPGPVVTPVSANVSASRNQAFAATSLFAASDPLGDAITSYDFWNSGAGGGHFVSNGQSLLPNQDNYVSAAQLAQTTYQTGSGTDTLWVRVSDGTEWSAWTSGFTVAAPVDTGPVVTPLSAAVSATHDQSFAAASLVTASDPFGDAITTYDFWDDGAGGGHFVSSGQSLAPNQDNYVSAAQLAQTSYQSGSGTDTLWVRVSDGTDWSAWTNGFTVTGPIDTGPVVAPVNATVSATHNETFVTASLFTASDPFGDAITAYDFWDAGTGGHLMSNSQALAAGQSNYVSAGQLTQTSYQISSGSDTLWARVSDGTEWSAWTSVTVTAPADAGPVVTGSSATTARGQTLAASSLFTASDPLGDAITMYDFWNTGAGGGCFAMNGQAMGAQQDNFVAASQLAQAMYQSGSGTDTLWVRAYDGGEWGAWSQPFAVSGVTH